MAITEYQNREIKGITLRNSWPVISVLVGTAITLTFLYAELKNSLKHTHEQSRQNYELLQQILTERKEDKKVTDILIKEIQQNQQSFEIKLTLLEAIIKK